MVRQLVVVRAADFEFLARRRDQKTLQKISAASSYRSTSGCANCWVTSRERSVHGEFPHWIGRFSSRRSHHNPFRLSIGGFFP